MSRLSDFINTGASSGSGGIYTFIEKNANEFRLDSVNTGVSRGSAFDLNESLNFESDTAGSVYLIFKMPDGFSNVKDIKIKHIAVLNSIDAGKDILFNTKSWVVDSGDTPDLNIPDSTIDSTITSQTDHMGTLEIITLPEIIISADLIVGNDQVITLKLTRDAANASDTYGGLYKLMAVQIYQE